MKAEQQKDEFGVVSGKVFVLSIYFDGFDKVGGLKCTTH